MNKIELEIGAKADVSDVEAKFAGAGGAVTKFGDDFAQATSKADAASSRLDGAAESADNMASRSSQAAGGIGDLGGALALMPGPLGKVGAGMEAVAPAIMGVTGAADLANLAFTQNIVKTTRARAAAIAHTTATKAQAVAQRVLNAVMRANPLGIIITLVLALVGAVVLAYKRSETFRRVVDAAMRSARVAIGWVVDKAMDLVTWFRDKIPAAAAAVRDRVVDVWNRIGDALGRVRDSVADFADAIRDKIGDAFDWVMDKIQPVVDAIQRLIDLAGRVRDIALPRISNPFNRAAATDPATAPVARETGTVNVNVRFEGLVTDPDRVARQIIGLINQRVSRTAGRVQVKGLAT